MAIAIAVASRWTNAADLPLQDWQAQLDSVVMSTQPMPTQVMSTQVTPADA